MPGVETMGVIGAVALGANLTCFFLLYRHRSDNLNMSSTWICSRNNLIANVGGMIAALFLKSSFGVLRAAILDLRKPLYAATQPMTPAPIRFSKIER